ncbi:MAG: hypothetical protein QF516_05235, partial [Pirellulaceae bacterium]|nr:hypothetical protein [Pirellulaceae bacterium]
MKGPFFWNIKPLDNTESGLRVLQRANAFPKKIQGTMRREQDPVSKASRPLSQSVTRGICQDLYYRLYVIEIEVPSLRARVNDMLIRYPYPPTAICRKIGQGSS